VLLAILLLIAASDTLRRTTQEAEVKQHALTEIHRLAAFNSELQRRLVELQRRLVELQTIGAKQLKDLEDLRGKHIIIPNELEGRVFFDSGSARIRNEFTPLLFRELSVVRSGLSSGRYNLVQIVGHTDSDPILGGRFSDNWDLGCARALAVLRYFEQQGISPTQLSVSSRGQFAPAAIGSDKLSKRDNRRIELILLLQ
jgi:chemotaxis protein MotB